MPHTRIGFTLILGCSSFCFIPDSNFYLTTQVFRPDWYWSCSFACAVHEQSLVPLQNSTFVVVTCSPLCDWEQCVVRRPARPPPHSRRIFGNAKMRPSADEKLARSWVLPLPLKRLEAGPHWASPLFSLALCTAAYLCVCYGGREREQREARGVRGASRAGQVHQALH